MPEPTTTAAASTAAILSAVSLALFGVDYYALLYALVGALVAVMCSESMGRGRAVVYVLLSTVCGAVLGSVLVEQLHLQSRTLLIASSLAGGVVAQALGTALFSAAPALAQVIVGGLRELLTRIAGGGKP